MSVGACALRTDACGPAVQLRCSIHTEAVHLLLVPDNPRRATISRAARSAYTRSNDECSKQQQQQQQDEAERSAPASMIIQAAQPSSAKASMPRFRKPKILPAVSEPLPRPPPLPPFGAAGGGGTLASSAIAGASGALGLVDKDRRGNTRSAGLLEVPARRARDGLVGENVHLRAAALHECLVHGRGWRSQFGNIASSERLATCSKALSTGM